MNTHTAISDATKTIPPISAVLLVLGALLFIFAWRMLQISPTPDRSATNVRTTYQAHRHQGVSVEGLSFAGEREPSRDLLPQHTAQSRGEAWN
ncbi:MAG: hypothetical protein ABI540_09260 [Spartobacteria bacterium]